MSATEDFEENDTVEVTDSAKTSIWGKNRYRWCTSEVRPSSKTRKHNILMKVPSLKEKARMLGDTADPFSIWNLLFSSNILQHIIQYTNKKLSTIRERYSIDSRHHVKDIDIIELNACLGLLIYTAISNSSLENIDGLFAIYGTGREIFRLVMSKKRFAVL